MDAERKLKKVKINLMRSPLFALMQGVMMVGKTSIDPSVPTARTDGRDEVYGRAFVDALPEKELAFLIAHEAGHKLFRHLNVWQKLYKENASLANQACDHVINLMLLDLDPSNIVISMPKFPSGAMKGKPMGLADPRFKGMNAKQVFDILKREEDGRCDDGDDESDSDRGGGSGNDGGLDDHDWEGHKALSEEQKKELEREIDQAIRQGMIAQQKQAGAGKGELDRALGELLEPKIDWREVLREFVKSTCASKDVSSWRRVNRRFLSGDVYMPTLIGEKVGRIAIGVDTSGSISGTELNEFLSEVKGIAEEVRPDYVDLIYWGSHVASHETYTGAQASEIIHSTKPVGGGGTDPECMSSYMKDNNIAPECVVMLTDGYVPNWGKDWPAPILWVISGNNKQAVADCGRTLVLEN